MTLKEILEELENPSDNQLDYKIVAVDVDDLKEYSVTGITWRHNAREVALEMEGS